MGKRINMVSCEIIGDQIPVELTPTDGAVRLKVAAASNMVIETKANKSLFLQSSAMGNLVRLVANEPMALGALKELQKDL